MSELESLHSLRDMWRLFMSRFRQHRVFYGHGCSEASDEAAWLIAGGLHLTSDELGSFWDCRLLPSEKQHLANLLDQRTIERIPTAYVLGEAWLMGQRFLADRRALIPRSFIAELIANDALAPWLGETVPKRIAEVCCGSASLAILLCQYFTTALVDACDLSNDALDLAADNVALYDLDTRITLLGGDLFQPLSLGAYDLIVINPPYVDETAMAKLPKEYSYEPRQALASGQDGLDHLRRIIGEAAPYLTAEGWLMVEVGHQRRLCEAAFPQLPFVWLDTASGDSPVFLLNRADLAG